MTSLAAFRKGLHLFRKGAFWEAHEVWEDLWREAQDPEKTLLKALIQVAAACIHAEKGHWRGVQGLLGRVARYLEQVPQGTLGVDVRSLLKDVQEALLRAREYEEAGTPGVALTLQIRRVSESSGK